MSTPDPRTPEIPTDTLINEARQNVPGDWLSRELSVQSNHWRLENAPQLAEADLALRALFLIAYRELAKPKPASEARPDLQAMTIDFSAWPPSLKERTDEAYGAGFYAAARAHSKVLVDRSPTANATELLSGLSDFLRAGPSGLEPGHCGAATRVLENVWEQMNVGWFN